MNLDLQRFAEGGADRTEKATPKKRREAREKGQVLQSREIASAMLLTFVFVTLRISGKQIYRQFFEFLKKVYTEYPKIDDLYTLNMIKKLFLEMITVFAKIILPVFAVAMVVSVAVAVAQVGFLFTTKTLAFKFERLNPFSGLKRIFSLRSVTELVKSILKITVISYTAYSYINGQATNVLNLMSMDVMNIAVYIGTTAVNVAVRICIVLIILGVFDYMYQWWEYEKSLRMSKHEIKEEYKQTEGNPEIKSKIKQKQRQMSMRRMMQEVPKADVIITNPTHFAVAVKYDAEVENAPVVLAKGQDYMALRIKDLARENKVEIVENKVLARSLYENTEVGQTIPPELYQAVAEVLAFVYTLKKK